MNKASKLQKLLFSSISSVACNIAPYTYKPGIDFSRNRLLSAEDILSAVICMGNKPIDYELNIGFKKSTIASTSAFCQQKAKIKPEAFAQVLYTFNDAICGILPKDTYPLRLVAVDGSTIEMQRNISDKQTWCVSHKEALGYNAVHLTALYDTDQDIYIDGIVQPKPKANESGAFCTLVDRMKDTNCIVVADRLFAGYNNFAHCIEKGIYFAIRVKDDFTQRLLEVKDLPQEVDKDIEVFLTRKRSKDARTTPGYRFISTNMRFDFIDEKHPSYTLAFRIVRFAIEAEDKDGNVCTTFENIATNLPVCEFGPQALKDIYHARWTIETSFKKLKYSVGLATHHSTTLTGVTQEIYASMTLYNFCSIMALFAQELVGVYRKCAYEYKVNYSNTVRVCREILWPRAGPEKGFLERIAKCANPVRPKRHFPRHKRLHSVVRLSYRG